MAGHDAKKTDLPWGMGRGGLVCAWGRAPGAGDPIHLFLPEPQLSSDGLRINDVLAASCSELHTLRGSSVPLHGGDQEFVMEGWGSTQSRLLLLAKLWLGQSVGPL